MGSYTFKSSGTTREAAAANTLAVTAPNIGIKTPLALSTNTNDIVVMNTDLATQITDNLRNLILTNWGERLGFYDFGANLQPLMTDLVSADDFDSQAQTLIQNAVQRWMPYIVLVDMTTTQSYTQGTQNQGIACTQLVITFNIPTLKVTGKKLQVSLFAI